MSEKAKEDTDRKQGSRKGVNSFEITSKAKLARKNANKADDQAHGKKMEEKKEASQRETKKNPNKTDEKRGQESPFGKAGQKHSRGKDEENVDSSKKTKGQLGITQRSEHHKADALAQRTSNGRLPKKGQTAHGKAMPCWVDGKVVEVLNSNNNSQQAKASQRDSQIGLKSNSSGKICVHKADNMYRD
ncbi:uncharacterized protein Z518_02489 [Rhinocladiella mackenziei CBS 650.93]|uniref:Hypervirulence associated protein TUDOR domain-containing protein n=1 Tax=Rhinocladiella mackenziei CBS 650.93 TaxID=1442369 RepID=A0A0D2JF46_9EURO|nr:uncharacterized protein Z518_02489 [Rhinocladiella mackenziei CBS 650.93]KIX07835.1 hypothetical protein Z518_02489 [Rhinocladiella mackenziei CBS 650.93]